VQHADHPAVHPDRDAHLGDDLLDRGEVVGVAGDVELDGRLPGVEGPADHAGAGSHPVEDLPVAARDFVGT